MLLRSSAGLPGGPRGLFGPSPHLSSSSTSLPTQGEGDSHRGPARSLLLAHPWAFGVGLAAAALCRGARRPGGKFSATALVGLEAGHRRRIAACASAATSPEPQLEDEETGGESEDSNVGRDVADSVVKVFVATSPTSYVRPWTKQEQSFSSGSAFPIDAQRLLTNAHVVRNATVVRVQRRGDYRKYVARVERLDYHCDLALLSVEAADFWQGLHPFEFDDELPELQADVAVVGYPGDSDNVCFTQGVVSRIDMNWYTHDVQLLALQIDAAINPGNSGGPVIGEDDRCVGVAFEKITGSDVDNVGYVIPTEVVHHFLADRGGVASAGIQYQFLESIAARSAFGLPSDETRGVRVRYIDTAVPANQVLQVNDIMLCADGVDIGYDGTVPVADGRRGERVALPYLMSRRHPGDIVEVEIWRDGKGLVVPVELASPVRLVPSIPPVAEYLIVGSLVFIPLSEAYLEGNWGADWHREASPYMVHLYDEGRRSVPDEQVLVLAHALCGGGEGDTGDEASDDLQRCVGQLLQTFNGQRVHNLRGLVQAVESGGRWLKLEMRSGDVVVLDGETLEEQRAKVMEVHRIQKPMQLHEDGGP